MNPDTISSWLQSAETLPDEADVKSLLQQWPWFVPARLMEAARQHSWEPFSLQSLSLVHLYGADWVSSYRLLTAADRQPFRSTAPAAPAESPYLTNGQAGEPAEDAAAKEHEIMHEPPVEEAASITQEATAPDGQEEDLSPAAHTGIPFIQPPYTEDYFRHQGVAAAEDEQQAASKAPAEETNTLMVVMSFTEWLNHFKVKSEQEREEEQEKSALRSMWQQEKLAAALEEEAGEIPEDVFEMAVSSITREDDLVTESLAEIMEKQEKWGAAAEMYRKLGLRNPVKSSYFASRAEAAKKRLL